MLLFLLLSAYPLSFAMPFASFFIMLVSHSFSVGPLLLLPPSLFSFHSPHSLALLLPVRWDGSRTAGSVLQSSVSGFNIPIQSSLAVFSHPAHAGTLSITLLLLLSFVSHHISLY